MASYHSGAENRLTGGPGTHTPLPPKLSTGRGRLGEVGNWKRGGQAPTRPSPQCFLRRGDFREVWSLEQGGDILGQGGSILGRSLESSVESEMQKKKSLEGSGSEVLPPP